MRQIQYNDEKHAKSRAQSKKSYYNQPDRKLKGAIKYYKKKYINDHVALSIIMNNKLPLHDRVDKIKRYNILKKVNLV